MGMGVPRLSGRQEEAGLGEEEMDHVSCPALAGFPPSGESGVHREGALQASLAALQLPAELGTGCWPRPPVPTLAARWNLLGVLSSTHASTPSPKT